MRRALMALILVGCTNAPDTIWLGDFESPCVTGGDCSSERPCVYADGFGACSESCSSDSQCPRGYQCRVSVSACVPFTDENECVGVHRRCGPSFPRCCGGAACVDFGGWGARCAALSCREDWECGSGFCCVRATNGETVCVPPTHCSL